MADKISRDMAEAEFERFCDENFIDTDLTGLDQEDVDAFEAHKLRIVKAICIGWVTIDDDATASIEISPELSLSFKSPNSSALMAADSVKPGKDIAKLNAVMASIVGKSPKTFAAIPMKQYQVCASITTLFLA